jgi:hypothetical protein
VKFKILGKVFVQESLEPGDPPEQVKPTSTLQSLLHPSPFTLLPSSHGRVNLFPSPQTSMHRLELKSK